MNCIQNYIFFLFFLSLYGYWRTLAASPTFIQNYIAIKIQKQNLSFLIKAYKLGYYAAFSCLNNNLHGEVTTYWTHVFHCSTINTFTAYNRIKYSEFNLKNLNLKKCCHITVILWKVQFTTMKIRCTIMINK